MGNTTLATTYSIWPRVIVASCIVLIGSVVLLWNSHRYHMAPPPGTTVLDSDKVTESSGLAISSYDEDLLWTHNDSGDNARLYAFTRQGKMQATLKIKQADAVDWEDLCSFQRDGKNYLAIADVGDNSHARRYVTIYVLQEPDLTDELVKKKEKEKEKEKGKDKKGKKEDDKKPIEVSGEVAFEVQVKYPTGAVNCESLAYDPWREQFILATKEQVFSRLFSIDFNTREKTQRHTAQLIGTFPLPYVTGAAITRDGTTLALNTYGPICMLHRPNDVDWTKASDEAKKKATWQQTNPEEPEFVASPPRYQGEAICFDKDGTHLLLTSEGTPMPIWIIDATVEKLGGSKE